MVAVRIETILFDAVAGQMDAELSDKDAVAQSMGGFHRDGVEGDERLTVAGGFGMLPPAGGKILSHGQRRVCETRRQP